ncbi:hypothetical protein ACSSS7_002716 [Eimeria intestinalis]
MQLDLLRLSSRSATPLPAVLSTPSADMSESPTARAARRRHASADDQEEEPSEPVAPKLLGRADCEWSLSTCVTGSPLVEHLALSAFDTFTAGCSLCVLAVLKPAWFQEVSDDVRSDEAELLKPSALYVSLLALICGLGGVLAKALVAVWCLNDRGLTLSSFLLSGASIGGYEGGLRLRGLFSLFVSWILVITAMFHLLGAPLECLFSSFLLSIFFATVGVAAPYASALAEACRSARWDAVRATERAASEECVTSGQPLVTSSSRNTGRPFTRAISAFVDGTLRCMNRLCYPLVFLCHKLQVRRQKKNGCKSTVLNPQELGNLLIILSVFPLIACGIASLFSCILLPMDWPTVYIIYPSPLVMAITVVYPLATLSSFLLLLLLPVFCCFPNRYARAYPVLQELMLGSR